MVKKTCT